MKNLILLLILLVPVFTISQIINVPAADSEIQQGNDTIKIRYKPKTFITSVSIGNPPKKLKGSLFQLNDSSMAVVPNELIKQDFYGEMESLVVKIDQVNMLKIRRKGSIVKGAVIGAISGLAIGFVVGLAIGVDENMPKTGTPFDIYRKTAAKQGLMYGAISMVPGAAIGALIGSISIKIPINGNQGTYEKNRKKLERYSVK